MELSQVVRVVNYVKWGTCSRTATVCRDPQVLSYQNNVIAVGLLLKFDNIIILDAITGNQTATLSGHTDWVRSLIFSLDGGLLVSGSDDKTVNLWDVQTGGVVKTFYGHTNSVSSVSISTDCTRIASGSYDQAVYVWNIQSGECHQSINLQHEVDYVGFSPTKSRYLISISGNKVQQWDINGNQAGPTYNASKIAFSHNSQFALCNENRVTIQNSDSGAIVTEFHLPGANNAQCCCFSPDDSLLAVASLNITYVWNITNIIPCLVATCTGHVNVIKSLVFSSSSSLISASLDRSIKFWKIGVLSADQLATELEPFLPTLVSVQLVSLQAKEGIAISGDSNGVVKIWDILTGLCKESFQTPARGDFHGDAQLIDGKLLFIWSWKGGIQIWDSEKGEIPQTLNSVQSLGLRISGDKSKVFNVNVAGMIQVWSMWTWELINEVELEVGHIHVLDPFRADGSRVWILSYNLAIKGWDFGVSDSTPILLSSSERPYLDFVDVSWHDDPPFIQNTETGNKVFRLFGKHIRPYGEQWDGQYLIAGFRDGEVLILDFKNLCY